MRLQIQQPTTKKEIEITLPATEKQLQKYCEALNIENDMKYGNIVTEVPFDEKMNGILVGNQYNLTELNFLFQSLDRFVDDEMNNFYAVATAKKLTDIKDLINLSFNEHCYSLVADFSDIQSLGKKLYFHEQGSASEGELDHLDGQKYVEDMIANTPNPLISPYGFIYPNKNQPEVLYTGKTFPEYLNGLDVLYVALRTETATEHLNLPCEQSEINKAMERLEIDSLDNTTLTVLMHNLPDPLEEILYEVEHDLHTLNDVSKALHDIGNREWKNLVKLCGFAKVDTVADFKTLCDSMSEFEMHPNIHTAEDYGRYMICESGRFEYDENLEEYINFKAYGDYRLSVENGVFTDNGYLNYLGYNQDMCNILNKNLGTHFEIESYSEILKIYMPLEFTTYYEEDDYGRFKETEYEGTISHYELTRYEDELNDFIKDQQSEIGSERELMEYYGESNSINAKVKSYHFEVEEINNALYGVAVCALNAPLDANELEELKSLISGQASDGVGEGIEQREFDLGQRDIYIHLWQSDDNWFIKTAEEMGFTEQSQNFEMKMT